MLRPQQWNIYKGMTGRWGSAQINLQPAHYYCSNTKCRTKNFEDNTQKCQCNDIKMIAREGNLFLDITSAIGANVYDWTNKIVMALSINDLGKILVKLTTGGEDLKLLHDPGAGSEYKGQVRKNLIISSPKGIENGCLITVTETNANSDTPQKKHTVPLSVDEVAVLINLIRAAIPRCLSW